MRILKKPHKNEGHLGMSRTSRKKSTARHSSAGALLVACAMAAIGLYYSFFRIFQIQRTFKTTTLLQPHSTTTTTTTTTATSKKPIGMSSIEDEIELELRSLIRRARNTKKEPIAEDVPFTEITQLDLSNCGLTEASLKDEFAALLPNLSILFLSNNHFQQMPAVIGKFPKLQMVAFKSNGLESIHPDALQPQLRWLILTDNQLRQLPDTIGRCTKLQKLMLSGNQLTTLPSTLSHCTNLELVRLATNQLSEPPLHVLQLPHLKWVALANNPFLQQVQPPQQLLAQVPRLDDCGWDDDDAEILGHGAGGITRKRIYRGQVVAVKTYHTSRTAVVTSDGLPEDERRISMAASQLSSALIPVLGECRDTGALVMEYLEDYVSLAQPPSLDSCTRDVYHNNDDNDDNNNDASRGWWSGTAARHLVSVVLDALHQLHAHGIMHGDLYGHNILIRRTADDDQVRLSDFGAAFFYDNNNNNARSSTSSSNTNYGQWLETIELRALAVLVAEVATELLKDDDGDDDDDTKAARSHLQALERACLRDGATFEQVQVWWKQRQLQEMAAAFGVGDGDE